MLELISKRECRQQRGAGEDFTRGPSTILVRKRKRNQEQERWMSKVRERDSGNVGCGPTMC